MTTTDWIVVGGALVGGVILGLLLSRIVHTILAKPTRPEPLQQAARPLSSLAFSGGLIAGLLVALGVIQPEAVQNLTNDAVAFIPKLLTAAIIVIGANVLSSFATAALRPTLARASSNVQRQAVSITRTTIMLFGVLLAVPTLGIDTTVVNLGVAAIFFALAASFTLLVGLGGRSVAKEIASTRAARRLIRKGDRIQLGGENAVAGEVLAVHPTAIEIATADGETVLIPSSRVVGETLTVQRNEEPVPEPPQGSVPSER